MESATKNKQLHDDIIKIVQRAFGSNFLPEQISIAELTEGYYNVAYDITLPDREVILKIAPPSSAVIMSYEMNIMQAEVDGLRLVKQKSMVPVPEVLYYDSSKDICDASYFFMNKLHGESFYKLKCNDLSQKEQDKIMRKAGSLNKAMNEIKGEGFGYLNQPDSQRRDWKTVFLQMINSLLMDGEKVEIDLGVKYIELINLVTKGSFALEEITEPVFVHGDLWDGNIFIKDGKIEGLIDFERSMWADPLMEYYFRRHSYNSLFIEGYGEDLRKKHPIRALLYDIYLYLVMVIETSYRNYPDDWQYQFATKQLYESVQELKLILN